MDEQPETAERAVVGRDERFRYEDDTAWRGDFDAADRDGGNFVDDVDRAKPMESSASSLLARQLPSEPENRTVRRELDPELRAVVDPVECRSTEGLYRSESEARGKFNERVGEALIDAREFASTSSVIDVSVGVHEAVK